MTMWEVFLLGYFEAGMIITIIAALGHKERFGYPMQWWLKICGVLIWPCILLIGGKKK